MSSDTTAVVVGPHIFSWGFSRLETQLLSKEQGEDNLFKNTYKMTVELILFLEHVWNVPGRIYKQKYPWIQNRFKFLL